MGDRIGHKVRLSFINSQLISVYRISDTGVLFSPQNPNNMKIVELYRLDATLKNGAVYRGYCFGRPATSTSKQNIREVLTFASLLAPDATYIDDASKRAWMSFDAGAIQWAQVQSAPLVFNQEATLVDIQDGHGRQFDKEHAELAKLQIVQRIPQEVQAMWKKFCKSQL